MLQLPERWRRLAWIAVTVALAGVSYWMFFSGRAETPASHASSPPAGAAPRP
jgi:EamA domain-containing membrane protein RarD